MAYTLGVNVCYGSHKLIRVELHYKWWDHLLHFKVLFHYSIGRVGNVVHNDVKVHLVGLVTIRVEALAHFDTVWMMQHFQYCQLTIFVSLILKYFLYCNCLAGLGNGGFENDAK